MPKLKLTEEQEKERAFDAELSRNMALYELDNIRLAKKLGMHPATFREKRRNPRTFKADELWKICRILKFTDEQKAKIM